MVGNCSVAMEQNAQYINQIHIYISIHAIAICYTHCQRVSSVGAPSAADERSEVGGGEAGGPLPLYGGLQEWGYPKSWMVYEGKSS